MLIILVRLLFRRNRRKAGMQMQTCADKSSMVDQSTMVCSVCRQSESREVLWDGIGEKVVLVSLFRTTKRRTDARTESKPMA